MINKFHEGKNNGQIIGMVIVDFRCRHLIQCIMHSCLKNSDIIKSQTKHFSSFISFLLNRKPKVVINDIESKYEKKYVWCPSGLNFGTSIILLFINYLPFYTENVFTDLYADNTTIYQISSSQHFIEQNLQAALEKLSLWCKHNEMLLNTDKTKVMSITTSQKRFHLHDYVLNLTYNSDILKNVNNDKVL